VEMSQIICAVVLSVCLAMTFGSPLLPAVTDGSNATEAPQSGRVKRYSTSGYQWENKLGKVNIQWHVHKYPSDITKTITDLIFRLAWNLWTDKADFTVEQVDASEHVHVNISFLTGKHGCSEEFIPLTLQTLLTSPLSHTTALGPGVSQVLVHFNDYRLWSPIQYPYRLLRVAAHEFGHALGLLDSSKSSALMYAKESDTSNTVYPKLSCDDIKGIQSLYGANPYITAGCVDLDDLHTLLGQKPSRTRSGSGYLSQDTF